MDRPDKRRCGHCRTVLRRGNLGELCDPCARAARTCHSCATLPGDFYDQPDVVTALATYDFGQFFKLVRTALEMTQEELGLLVGMTQSRVCKIENGALYLRDIADIVRVATTLKVPVDLLGFAGGQTILEGNRSGQEVSWLHRRDFVTTVTAITFGAGMAGSLHERMGALLSDTAVDPVDPPRRIGLADVERIEATTAAFRDWDDRWGGGGLSRSVILGQLRWVIDTSKNAIAASEAVQRRLLVAAADLAGFGAWINYDVERHDQARRLWMVALDAAREADNQDLAGHLLRAMAHQALHLKRPDEALRLVRLAYATTADSDHGTTELALSQISAYEALSYAAAGNPERCKRALGKAEDHFDNVQSHDTPPWRTYFDEVELRGLCGHAYHVLADHHPEAADTAEPLLRQAIAERSPRYPRIQTLNYISLASTYFQRGDGIEEGVRVGYQALDGARTLNSPRSLARLRGLDRLSARYAREPEVAEFREQLQLVLADPH